MDFYGYIIKFPIHIFECKVTAESTADTALYLKKKTAWRRAKMNWAEKW